MPDVRDQSRPAPAETAVIDSHQPAAGTRIRLALMRIGWALRRLLAPLLRPWRRSLHLRVVSITMLLGMLVSFALGSFIYWRVTTELVEHKVAAATRDAAVVRNDLVRSFGTAIPDPDDESLNKAAADVVQRFTEPDASRLAVLSPAGTAELNIRTTSSEVDSATTLDRQIPRSLISSVDSRADTVYSQIARVAIERNGTSVPAVFVGTRVDLGLAGANDLVLVYPMSQEEQSRIIVRDSLWLGGILLTLLLGGLAYMVTRLVVTPIRSVRHVAERLAAGALNERMRVVGEDDLARLATSFNAMADSLQSQIRRLEDLSAVQQRFSSDVSHELRTPLTTIRMAADLLYAGREDFRAPAARSAELLNKELDRFEALLTDLLEISRFDAGVADLSVDEVDLRDVVHRVVEAFEPLAARLGTEVVVSAPQECGAEMDQRRVERIVRNLVSNAIEHSEGRPVQISIAGGETAVALTVLDHGVGLKPGEASMVFNRFWRADPARARTTGGTGLGLSISLEDARLHEGWLQAWGEPGVGSCFRLTLPRRRGVPIKRSPLPLVPPEQPARPVADPA